MLFCLLQLPTSVRTVELGDFKLKIFLKDSLIKQEGYMNKKEKSQMEKILAKHIWDKMTCKYIIQRTDKTQQ